MQLISPRIAGPDRTRCARQTQNPPDMRHIKTQRTRTAGTNAGSRVGVSGAHQVLAPFRPSPRVPPPPRNGANWPGTPCTAPGTNTRPDRYQDARSVPRGFSHMPRLVPEG
eukprot:2659780-Rhodomonas_salina.2